jgi:anti-repressor protein
MNELIKINNENRVNARDLHQWLEIGKHFKDWMHEKINNYGFIEGVDFNSFLGDRPVSGGRQPKEYLLSISCAKELCMLANSEKGKQARLYFIECEKQLTKPDVSSIGRKEVALMLLQAEEELEKANKQLLLQAPKIEAYSLISDMKGVICMKDMANMLALKGVNAHKLHLWLVHEGYYYHENGKYRPYKKYIEKGFFIEKLYNDKASEKVYPHYYLTPLGTQLISENKKTIEGHFYRTKEVV